MMREGLNIEIAGVDRCCDFIEPSHMAWGRSSLDGQPDATTFTGVMRCDTPAAVPALGQTIDVYYNNPVLNNEPHGLRGWITDVSVEVVDGIRYASVMAADPLSVLNDIKLGDEPWPAEYASVRLERILNLAAPIAGWSYGLAQSILFIGLRGRDVDDQPALKLCHETADSADSVFYFDNGTTTAGGGLGGRTEGFRLYNRDATIGINPVLEDTEGSPRQYRNKSGIINAVRAAYGSADPQLNYAAEDAASIAAHLRRFKQVGQGELANLIDAETVCDAVLARWSQPKWTYDGVVFTASSHSDKADLFDKWQDPRRLIGICPPYDTTTAPVPVRILSVGLDITAGDWVATMQCQEA